MKKLLLSVVLLFLLMAVTGRATISAEITRVDFPSTIYVNETVPIRIWISNTGDTAYNFSVGLTVGKNLNMTDRTFHSDIYCNRDCYDDDQGDYGQTGLIAPADNVVVTRYYRFRPDVFVTGQTYGLIADVFNATYLPPTSALDWHGYPNNITALNSTVDAKIVDVKLNSQPQVGSVEPIYIYVKNTGNQPKDFAVGLTIGDGLDTGTRSFSGLTCNNNCYKDGIGDYAHTGLIASGDTVKITRYFYYDPKIFQEGNFYDFEADVDDNEYTPPLNVLGWYGVIGVPYMQPAVAYGTYAVSNLNISNQGDMMTVTGYIYNNGTKTNTWSVMMMLGRWDSATQGTVYSAQQISAIPICDVDCMVDKKGFQTVDINGKTSVGITAKYKIPDYFPSDSRVDLAIAVYDPVSSKKPLQGRCPSYTAGECSGSEIGNIVCIGEKRYFCTQFGAFNCYQNLQESCTVDINLRTIVYFKNITFVSSQLTETRAMGKAVQRMMDGGTNIIATGLDTDITGARMMLWIAVTMIVSTGLTIISKHKEAFPVIAIMMFIGGLGIGFIPAVFFIIFTLLAGGVLIYFLRSYIMG